jgi:hypothetical protein
LTYFLNSQSVPEPISARAHRRSKSAGSRESRALRGQNVN